MDSWEPIYQVPFPFEHDADGNTLTPPEDVWKAWKREHPDTCRDCGTTRNVWAGSAGETGTYDLCDDCTPIADCRTDADGIHHPHWSDPPHTPAEHELMVRARERRRARYLRAHPTERQGVLF